MHLDLRHLGAKYLEERLPFICELAKAYVGVDPAKEPIPVRPTAHYTMGGIETDGRCATRMPGLYAVGECASVGIHGADRLGSNSLVEIVVFGRIAGEEAPSLPASHPHGNTEAALQTGGCLRGSGLSLMEGDGHERPGRYPQSKWVMRWSAALASTAPKTLDARDHRRAQEPQRTLQEDLNQG